MNDHVFEDPMRNIKLSPNAITVEKTSEGPIIGRFETERLLQLDEDTAPAVRDARS